MSAERCERCDLPRATAEQWETMRGGEGADLCWAADGLRCAGEPVDWRARALAAEAKIRVLETDVRLAREFADVKDREAAWSALGLTGVAGQRDAALADAKHMREREAHFARALSVADGGRYRTDWDGALRRMIAERDEAQRMLAVALRGELPHCDSCDSYATRVAVDDETTHTSRRETYACDVCFASVTEDAEDWQEMPHAAMVRDAMERR